ncbi:MAG TPA: Gfo/Idh/MocA family oxidoreductase [Phycisphaerae bacterium]|nr:Gfo/Idh/MocA family oxidoreductase [Phycisphaerae bacterium]HPS52264.1 Gfo/Idh/MocA family oxidoreductase [Phycisphaerae bacterium]
MTNRKTVRFGLLGAGLIAPFHAKSILAADGCELVAVASRTAEHAAKIAGEYNCKAYSSLDELLADKTIDVINILTPNHLHYEATIRCAKAGKHVLVEKPPAMSLAQTDEMIAACRQAGVKLGIMLNCRARGPVRAIKTAIEQGRFGRLLQADAYMKWYRSTDYYFSGDWRSKRSCGAGVTVQHAFHYIDLLQYLMGPAAKVQARMSNMAHPQVELEDSLMSFINFKNGAQGAVVASTALWPGKDVRIEITGENGTAIMVGSKMDTWKFRDEQPEDEQIRRLGADTGATAASGPADFDFADHQVVIEAMAKAIRENCQPLITAESARNTLEIALAMYQSAADNKIVELPISNEESIWNF